MPEPKTCFVVQGYGEKTDFTDGRSLNLDASYQVIKEAVEAAGLRCIRSDAVVKSGTIDIAMYDWILKADLVIADLSTYNVNAAYELGVRYGVAPRATIIVAEEKFKSPFDVTHIVLHRYKHLGEDIGVAEARRFKAHLVEIIPQVLAGEKPDSPVYELLPLEPPVRRQTRAAEIAVAAAAAPASGTSAKDMLEQARAAMNADRFVLAKQLLQTVHEQMLPNDQYVLQQLALATYKSKDPDPATAFAAARHILQAKLNAESTNDPETLGLWGAVHKRLWEVTAERAQLDSAIAGYERGFYLKQDFYNGINLAFLLNVRAGEHRKAGEIADAVADFVLAQRVRREVIPICERARAAGPRTPADNYWILATLWEAAHGLQDAESVAKWQPLAEAAATAPWMLETTRSQLTKLSGLLEESPLKHLSLT